MNKIKSDKINFDNEDFLVEFDETKFINKRKNHSSNSIVSTAQQNINSFDNNPNCNQDLDSISELDLNSDTNLDSDIQSNPESDLYSASTLDSNPDSILDNPKTIAESQDIIKQAQTKAQEIIEKAKQEADKQAKEIIENAQEQAKKEAQELLLNSQEELEKIRIQATKEGYQDGHKDGLEKIQEELEEKIEAFSNFCSLETKVKDKVLKAASRDILEIINNISQKILHKELTPQILDRIIKTTIEKLEKKEDVTIIVSEKYAKLLFELQNKSLDNEIEFNFENFKQYDNFNLIYNPKYSDDTIIIENFKERFDASIKSQLDIIIRNIYDNSKNAQFDLEEYLEPEVEPVELIQSNQAAPNSEIQEKNIENDETI